MTDKPSEAMIEAGRDERSMWLVWGIKGEYSDRSEWPVSLYADAASAQAACVRLKELSRDLLAIFQQREDELDDAGDWDGKTLLTSTDEGRAFLALHGEGYDLAPGSYGFDDMEFTCCEVPVRTAIAALQPNTAEGKD